MTPTSAELMELAQRLRIMLTYEGRSKVKDMRADTRQILLEASAALTACAEREERGVWVPREFVLFMLGEGPFHGIHFGELVGTRGKFWWRKNLRAMLAAAAREDSARMDAGSGKASQK